MNTIEPGNVLEIPLDLSHLFCIRIHVIATRRVSTFLLDYDEREKFLRGDDSYKKYAGEEDRFEHSLEIIELPVRFRWYLCIVNRNTEPVEVWYEARGTPRMP